MTLLSVISLPVEDAEDFMKCPGRNGQICAQVIAKAVTCTGANKGKFFRKVMMQSPNPCTTYILIIVIVRCLWTLRMGAPQRDFQWQPNAKLAFGRSSSNTESPDSKDSRPSPFPNRSSTAANSHPGAAIVYTSALSVSCHCEQTEEEDLCTTLLRTCCGSFM